MKMLCEFENHPARLMNYSFLGALMIPIEIDLGQAPGYLSISSCILQMELSETALIFRITKAR